MKSPKEMCYSGLDSIVKQKWLWRYELLIYLVITGAVTDELQSRVAIKFYRIAN